MNLITPTQTTTGILSLSPAASGAETPKNGALASGDGFGDLLSQLSSIVPDTGAAGLVDAAIAADRQIAGLPTGKDLPVAANVPGAESDGLEAASMLADARPDETLIAVGSVIVLPGLKKPPVDDAPGAVQAMPSLTADISDSSTSSRPATGAALPFVQPAAGDVPLTTVAAGAATAAAQPAKAQLPNVPTAAMANLSSAAPADNAAPTAPQGIAVRIAAADAPVAPAVTAPIHASAQPQASVASTVAVQAVATAPAAADRASSPSRESAAANATPTVHPVVGSQAHRADTTAGQSRDQRGGEQANDGASLTKPVQAAGDVTKPIAAAIQNAADLIDNSVRTPATTARPVATDPLANIERIVDQLSTARQFDLSKPAAIAVAHREFGGLTVTFDQSANDVMNVRIAAEDNEAQKALSAAIAADRGAQRGPETQVASTQANTAPGQTGGERAAGNGQANTQAGSAGQGADDRRSGQSDNRERRDERTTQHNTNTPQSSADDALYA